ncbi:DUF5787 family protein [Halococcoides cellulosivorans]|uniref:Uncharacterized protein n=1 Tax=Halococcoides cellulosivorans TaxID=1679096 RepID=A0A2R4X2Y1_9EURY|nr:DUF5787 family protein [Halococcoides cellulosivorans]AWB28144.1 hypothetical protein HARCEL1_10725 [Halococcoides cellulosivorans]
MREAAFELAVCAHVEERDRVLARQIGTGVDTRRIADVIVLDPGPDFETRASITDRAIPPVVIEAFAASDPRPAAAVDAHPEHAQRAIEHALDAGALVAERDGRRTTYRLARPYPDDWVDSIVAIENKPDLDRPGDLRAQVRHDVSLGVVDRVVLVTASHVTGAHEHRVPDPVGIWQFDPASGERRVVREALSLDPDDWGLEVLDRDPGAWTIETVDQSAKRRRRIAIAERAYGAGWRPSRSDWPACARCSAVSVGTATLPDCAWADRIVDPRAECGPDCPGFEAAADPDVAPSTPDPDRERDNSSAWVRDPPGPYRQVGLDQFSRKSR